MRLAPELDLRPRRQLWRHELGELVCIAGRFSPLAPIAIFPFISTQHALKKADLLGDYIDRLLSGQRRGDGSSGINRFQLFDCVGEFSLRVRQ